MLVEKGLNSLKWVANWNLVGNSMSLFKGPGTVPVETVQCLLGARRAPDGKWKHFAIKDPDGHDARFQYHSDKSLKTMRMESITNKFCNILREK